ncbi:MAG TPA: alpha/beta hydrolase [Candidatus Kapabacteria bacterium]|nr:alpha/beta hydrolase [Candidatus Kapabacteria bacterium]
MQKTKILLVMLLTCFLWACKTSVQEEKGPRAPEFPTIPSSKTIVFVHGLYLTPASWSEWETYFQDLGFTTYSPAWPYHDLSVDEQNALHPNSELGTLTLPMVLQHYRDFIATLEEPPILIGHSMGGLVVQLLLEENIAAAGIVIHSAPPFGVISIEPKFLKASWPLLNPALNPSEPSKLTFKQFQHGFVNGMDLETQQDAYAHYCVPDSLRVGRSSLSRVTKVDKSVSRPPLLIIAGDRDNTVTASMNYVNFKLFHKTPAITDYKQFPDRNHWTLQQDGWQAVADYAAHWIEENSERTTGVSLAE